MSASMPLIYISAATADYPFVHGLSTRLQSRGLLPFMSAELNPTLSPAEIGRAINDCALFFVVASAASMASRTVWQEYHDALSRGKPVIPILTQPLALPPELQPLQWVDYRGSDEDGWRVVLVALASVGIARFPAPQPPVLDAEVVLAQALAGRIPPSWTVYRHFVRGSRKVSGIALVSAGTVILLTAIAAVVTAGDLLVLAPNVCVGVVLFLRFSPRRLIQEKQGDVLIVTPEGFVVHQRGGDLACSFHDTAAIIVQAESLARITTLLITPTGNRPPYSIAIGWRFSLTTAIAEHIITLHRAYMSRYLTATPIAQPAPALLIFISHARKDAAFVDILELNLRQRGLNPWVDRTMLAGGQQWPEELRQAIEQCIALVVVVTPTAVASAAVHREYTYALQLGKPVLAVLAESTGAIPPVLGQRICADYRPSAIQGLMALNVALDDLGIRPTLSTGMYQLDSSLIVARAYQGHVPPGGHVFRGGIPRRMIGASLYLAFFGLVVGPLVYLATRAPFILFDDPILFLGLSIPFVQLMWQKKRLPDLIITLPAGVITFERGMPIEAPFVYLSAVSARLGLWSSRVLMTPKGSQRPFTLRIHSHFREHRRIAQQIAADYYRYASHTMYAAPIQR